MSIANERRNFFSVFNAGLKKLVFIKQRLVINMLKSEVFERADVV